jgi:hypothetical protein
VGLTGSRESSSDVGLHLELSTPHFMGQIMMIANEAQNDYDGPQLPSKRLEIKTKCLRYIANETLILCFHHVLSETGPNFLSSLNTSSFFIETMSFVSLSFHLFHFSEYVSISLQQCSTHVDQCQATSS